MKLKDIHLERAVTSCFINNHSITMALHWSGDKTGHLAINFDLKLNESFKFNNFNS